MTGLSRIAWAIAILSSVVIHTALALGLSSPDQSAGEPPAGTPIEFAGSLADVLGSASPAKAVDGAEQAIAVTEPAVLQPVSAGAVARPTEARTMTAEPVTAVTAAAPAPIAALTAAATSATIELRENAEPASPTQNRRPAPPAKPKLQAAVTPVPEKLTPAPAETTARRVPRKREPEAKPHRSASLPARSGSDRQGAAALRRGGSEGRSTASPGAVAGYNARVRSRILANRPAAHGSGQVIVSFAVNSFGRLRYARIARSSGRADLDAAVLGAVRNASPFPAPPAGTTPTQLSFTIPFTFR